MNIPVQLAITFHCLTLSSNLSFQKILYTAPVPQSVSVCRTDLVALDLLPDLCAHQFLCLVLFVFDLIIHTCGRLSWPVFDKLFGARKILID